MSEKAENVYQEQRLKHGAAVIPEEALPLNSKDWQLLETLFDTLEFDNPTEPKTGHVFSFQIFRVKNPKKDEIFSDKIYTTVNSKKMRDFLEATFGITKYLPMDVCRVLKYEKGEFLEKHVDGDTGKDHEITLVFILNDTYEGGDFIIYQNENEKRFHPKAHSLIILSPNTPHEITTITKGTRKTVTCSIGTPHP